MAADKAVRMSEAQFASNARRWCTLSPEYAFTTPHPGESCAKEGLEWRWKWNEPSVRSRWHALLPVPDGCHARLQVLCRCGGAKACGLPAWRLV